ncbi:MAG: helix-turn-helix domain-containing protein [PVC group bacterium]|nr:helix-turn-helix domain-containing protein [PVC group bacterium]
MIEKRFVGIKELAEYLDIKAGTLSVWVCYKKIPYVKVGRLVKFDLQKIEKWIEEREVKTIKD